MDDLYQAAYMWMSGATFFLAEYRTEAGRSIFISSVRCFNIVADHAYRCRLKTDRQSDLSTVSPKLHRSGSALAYIPNSTDTAATVILVELAVIAFFHIYVFGFSCKGSFDLLLGM